MHPPTDLSRRRFLQASAMTALAATTIPNLAFAQDQPAPNTADKKIGYALVGLGRLSTNQLLPAFAESKHCKVTALVSGHPDKAKQLAGGFGVPEKNIYSYENFDTIKDNPDVDVVYVVLPNSMHAEYTIRAAKAGKHVLCEKPMANTPEECQQMIDACKAANKKLMIGYRLRYEPHHIRAIEMVQKQTYGKLRMMNAEHSFNIGPNQWRTNKKLAGGGPLMDVGIYCLNFSRYLSGEEPVAVSAQSFQDKSDPRFQEVESSMAFTLHFPSGALAACTTSYEHAGVGQFHFMTDKALVACDPAFGYGGLKMSVRSGGGVEMLDIPQVNHFASEMDHFAECVTGNQTPRTPGEEGLQDLKIMMKLYESAATGKTVEV